MYIKELDSYGKTATFFPGDRVCVLPLKIEATVVEQYLTYDCGTTFWGNVKLLYDDGIEGTSNSWQLKHIEKY